MAETLEELRKIVREEDAEARLEAAFTLAQLGYIQELQPVFAELLQNEEPDIRSEAAHRLGWIGPTWSVDQLGPLVNDEEGDVRHDSIFALVETCRVSAVDRLAEGLLNADPETREDTRVALVALLGRNVAVSLDFVAAPEQEHARFLQWWVENQAWLHTTLCYADGKVTDVRQWIDSLKSAPTPVVSWLDERLRYWTGFTPASSASKTGARSWEQWIQAHGKAFEPGKRYFYGHLVD